MIDLSNSWQMMKNGENKMAEENCEKLGNIECRHKGWSEDAAKSKGGNHVTTSSANQIVCGREYTCFLVAGSSSTSS